jgi:hypothetical protein
MEQHGPGKPYDGEIMMSKRSMWLFVLMCGITMAWSSAQAYYNPQAGRFIQRDPLGYVDGMNLYEYVMSKPGRGLDPSGKRITLTQKTQLEGNEPVEVVEVHATVQAMGCKSAEEAGKIKNKIEDIWTGTGYYKVKVFNGTSEETVIKTIKLETKVDINHNVDVASKEFDPDRHTFYLVDKNYAIKDRSFTYRGKSEAWIYKEDHAVHWVYAHEFGHWLTLQDGYNEFWYWDANGQIIYKTKPKDDSWKDNVMGDWGGTWVSGNQMKKIWDLHPNQYNKGLPIQQNNAQHAWEK